MEPKISLFHYKYFIKHGPTNTPTKMGIGGTVIVALYLMSRFGARDSPRVVTRPEPRVRARVISRPALVSVSHGRCSRRGAALASAHEVWSETDVIIREGEHLYIRRRKRLFIHPAEHETERERERERESRLESLGREMEGGGPYQKTVVSFRNKSLRRRRRRQRFYLEQFMKQLP